MEEAFSYQSRAAVEVPSYRKIDIRPELREEVFDWSFDLVYSWQASEFRFLLGDDQHELLAARSFQIVEDYLRTHQAASERHISHPQLWIYPWSFPVVLERDLLHVVYGLEMPKRSPVDAAVKQERYLPVGLHFVEAVVLAEKSEKLLRREDQIPVAQGLNVPVG